MIDNKNSYFELEILPKKKATTKTEQIELRAEIEDLVEPILSKMGANAETYVINNKKKINRIIFLFGTNGRKRISLLRNTIRKHINPLTSDDISSLVNEEERMKLIYLKKDIPSVGYVTALTKKEFYTKLDEYREDKDYQIKGEALFKYRGKDLEIFKDKSNWYKWQRKLYDLLYTEHGSFKESSDREIIFIEDSVGSTGKSKFFKKLYTEDQENIAILSEATLGQLKENIVKLGERKLYLIDLPRTAENGNGSYNALMNSIESLKNGIINSSFRGGTGVLITSPPWIVIAGNKMPEGNWTPDRWKVYEIQKDGDWKDISKQRRRRAKQLIQIENEIQRESFNMKRVHLKNIKNKIAKTEGVS